MTARLLSVPALTMLVIACAPTQQAEAPMEQSMTEAEARTLVDAMLQEWDAATAAGDYEAAAEMYAEDAIRMQPGAPPMVGRAAILAWLQQEGEQYTFEGSNETLEVRVIGPEWIMLTASSDFTMTPTAGGESTPLKESWLTIVRRQADGSWKWYRDAGSSDLPR